MSTGSPTAPSGRLSWKTIARISPIITVLIFLALAAISHRLSIPPKYVVEADVGFRKAQQTIDPEKLRAWALVEMAKYRGAGVVLPDSEIPGYVKKLYSSTPEDASLKGAGNDQCTTIVWGGGFFHWVFYVGSTNFTMPRNRVPEDTYTIAQWVPGIYYGREDTRHPIQ